MVKLGDSYDSDDPIETLPVTAMVISSLTDKNNEVIHEKSISDSENEFKIYLSGDSFRWNLTPFIQAAASETVITSRYYLDTDDIMIEEPDVFVYEIAERYIRDLDMIPGYNTVALTIKNTN